MLRREFEFWMVVVILFFAGMGIKGCVLEWQTAPVEAPPRGASLHGSPLLSIPTSSMQSPALQRIAVLPRAPITGSPVPWLTSLYHKSVAGPYGDRRYPGNCGGELIKDLLTYFKPKRVLDPMTGSGTCADVCRELGIECESFDLKTGVDFAAPGWIPKSNMFDFVWIHPPYWRQKVYSDDPRDMSMAGTLDEFLRRYEAVIENAIFALVPGGKLAILMGDYSDRDEGFVPLTYHTKQIAFDLGMKQTCTDIIRFSHGASSSTKTYRSSFIPGLHDVCSIFTK